MDQATTEKALELPAGHKLDLLIAERVMGRQILTMQEMESEAYDVWKTQPQCTVFSLGFEARKDGVAVMFKQIVSSYSTDIAIAFRMVHALEKKIDLHLLRVGREFGEGQWLAQFSKGQTYGAVKHAYGATPELALCRAALLGVLA